jgi:NAD(P)H-hydrate epimerase
MHPADLPRLPTRDAGAHKGTFGTVAVFGGCAAAATRMIGAPALAAAAALRGGCGLARIYGPAPILDAALTITPGATGRAIPTDAGGSIVPHEAAAAVDEAVGGCTCLAIGPGLGRGDGPRAAALRAVQQEAVPVVVDADALNALAETPQVTRDFRAAALLTPHPGEFRRLARGLGVRDDLGLDGSRAGAAEQLARRLGCIVVLKGAGTVVTDGSRTWVNPSGHPCLATGGTGDVLTGLIASLVAQFVGPMATGPSPTAVGPGAPRAGGRGLDLYDAARVGVYVHGLAGERWARDHGASGGLLATDLPALIPAIVEGLRGG